MLCPTLCYTTGKFLAGTRHEGCSEGSAKPHGECRMRRRSGDEVKHGQRGERNVGSPQIPGEQDESEEGPPDFLRRHQLPAAHEGGRNAEERRSSSARGRGRVSLSAQGSARGADPVAARTDSSPLTI